MFRFMELPPEIRCMVYKELFLDAPKDALPLLTSCHQIHDEFVAEIMRTDTPTLVYLECDRITASRFLEHCPFSPRIIQGHDDSVECSMPAIDSISTTPKASPITAESEQGDDIGPSCEPARQEWLAASKGPYAMRLSVKCTEVPLGERVGVMLSLHDVDCLRSFLFHVPEHICVEQTAGKGMAATKQVRIDFHKNLLFMNSHLVHENEFELVIAMTRRWWGLSDVKVYGEIDGQGVSKILTTNLTRRKWNTSREFRAEIAASVREVMLIPPKMMTWEQQRLVLFTRSTLRWTESTAQFVEWVEDDWTLDYWRWIHEKLLREISDQMYWDGEPRDLVACPGGRRHSI